MKIYLENQQIGRVKTKLSSYGKVIQKGGAIQIYKTTKTKYRIQAFLTFL